MNYFSHEHPIRLAHRGSCILWPENTLHAIQGAAGYKCQYIETDLHVTRDGVIVLFHDGCLERLTNGRGKIAQWLWQDIKKLDAAYFFNSEQDFPLRGKGIGIPTLDQAMTTFPNMKFNLDLKQPGIETDVADFIQQKKCHDRVLIASFSSSRSTLCRRLLNEKVATSAGFAQAMRFWLFSRIGRKTTMSINALQVCVSKAGLTVVDRRFVSAAHDLGLQVHVWTINSKEEMKRLLDLGVDGIVTDRIDLLNQVVGIE